MPRREVAPAGSLFQRASTQGRSKAVPSLRLHLAEALKADELLDLPSRPRQFTGFLLDDEAAFFVVGRDDGLDVGDCLLRDLDRVRRRFDCDGGGLSERASIERESGLPMLLRRGRGCREIKLLDLDQELVAPVAEGLLRGLRAYPGRAIASVAFRAFLKAMRPLASWSRARWLQSFFDQRIRIPRLRLSQEWVASTTQRRARQPGMWSLSAISSPRARMCGVN